MQLVFTVLIASWFAMVCHAKQNAFKPLILAEQLMPLTRYQVNQTAWQATNTLLDVWWTQNKWIGTGKVWNHGSFQAATVGASFYFIVAIANAVEICANVMELIQYEPEAEILLSRLMDMIRTYANSKEVVEALLSNEFYDDLLWHSLAWIRVYEVMTASPTKFRDLGLSQIYLQLAQQFYARVHSESWDTLYCQGGCWWSMKRDYKNAVTNELFIVASIRLFKNTGIWSYADSVQKGWDWFLKSGMWDREGSWLINDGLDLSTCRNNRQPTWTYNQGIILGALADLALNPASVPIHQTSQDLIQMGIRLIDAVILRLTHSSGVQILVEPCDYNAQGYPTDCGADGQQFKGIFMRYLGYFMKRLGPSSIGMVKYAAYTQFVAANVASVARLDAIKCKRPTGFRQLSTCYGQHWLGTASTTFEEKPSDISHCSALDLFMASLMI